MDLRGPEIFGHVTAAAAGMDHAATVSQGEALRVHCEAAPRRSSKSKLVVAVVTLAALVVVGVLAAL